ncbi:MAG: hypothetical protein JW928_04415, partial [Candidatus Aureabacteria bacterium]|nr:hypothetical protein [Candidatus Auribacterota bacterium]
ISKDPVELANSVESCELAKELAYAVDPEYYSFLMMLIGQSSELEEVQPEEEEIIEEEPEEKDKDKDKDNDDDDRGRGRDRD